MLKLPRIVAIIEARMTSSRLPGKVLMTACGKSMLELLVERLHRVASLDDICIATTTNATDDPVAALADQLGVLCFRGSEHDVLGRVAAAAAAVGADIVAEVTGDCPLMDPAVLDLVIQDYLRGGADLVGNAIPRSYPLGMDTFVFSRATIEAAAAAATDPLCREHVVHFLRINPERFPSRTLTAPETQTAPNLHLTLDYREDYEMIRGIYEALYPDKPDFSLDDVLALLKARPELRALNAHLRPHV